MSNIAQINKPQTFDLTPSNLQEAMELAKIIASSDVVPKVYKNNPGNVLVAVQMGAEVGFKPMQALQNIAVINGNPCIWGDGIPALIQIHPKYEWMKEAWDESRKVASCTIKRKGEEPHTVTFGLDDAKAAGLLNKDTYKNYLKRMCQMRARSWAARDKFADALKGLKVAEEVQDYPVEKDITPAQEAPKALEDRPTYPAEEFTKNLPKWQEVIASGRKTADDLIAMVESKAPLTEEQKQQIKGPAPIEGEAE